MAAASAGWRPRAIVPGPGHFRRRPRSWGTMIQEGRRAFGHRAASLFFPRSRDRDCDECWHLMLRRRRPAKRVSRSEATEAEMQTSANHRIFSLGDSALTVEFGNSINIEYNKKAIAFAARCDGDGVLALIEAVPAYSSTTIFTRSAGGHESISHAPKPTTTAADRHIAFGRSRSERGRQRTANRNSDQV